jgi:AraC-like DNA-binding protein
MGAVADPTELRHHVSHVGRMLDSAESRALVQCHPRAEWVCTVANAFQALVGGLSGSVAAEPIIEPFEQTSEPINEVERLIFRCYVSELLLGALYLGDPVFRRDAVESILSAWPIIRKDLQPVSVLRRALGRKFRSVLAADFRLAEQVRDLLNCRFAEKIVARNVADEFKVSESRMNRCFRLAYGCTIHQHLLMVRVRHGLDLISKGTKIEAAGLAVGFKSKKDFYRAVQHTVGCTPAQFRSRILTPWDGVS